MKEIFLKTHRRIRPYRQIGLQNETLNQKRVIPVFATDQMKNNSNTMQSVPLTT